MDNELLTNLWGWLAGLFLFAFDHWSGAAAFVLFAMQAVYQFYRIKKAKKDLAEREAKDGSESTSSQPGQE